MKRMICIILTLLLLMGTAGCGTASRKSKNALQFYYTREEYRYGEDNGVIVSESREIAGHMQDSAYLLGMYLLGPETQGLTLPFPEGTRLGELERDEKKITVTLIPSQTPLPEISFTLACTCLAKTCMDAFSVDTVTIRYGEQSKVLTQNSMILFDSTSLSNT